MTRFLRILPRALAAMTLLLAWSGAALGHAVVVETAPADGALVDSAPEAVVIRFNEPVRPVRGQILDASGADVTPPDAVSVEGPALRIALPPALAPGSYIASYRVVSIDSHPVGGSIVFSVERVSSRVTAPTGAADDFGWRLAIIAVRAILYAGILGGAGGVLFLLLLKPAEPVPARAARRIAAAFAAAGCLAALAAIGVQGGLLLAGPLASLAEPATWRIGLASSYGITAATAALGLALVAAGLWPQRSEALRPIAWLGAAAALASFTLSGHVVTAGPRWLTAPVLIVHTSAAAFWAGALAPLLQAIGELDRAAAPLVARFSRRALAAVTILIVAGAVIAVLQVDSLSALVETRYGLILIAKIGLVAGLIALAAVNKLRLTPSLARGLTGAATALRRTIAAEIALVLAILIATAALGTTPPPRAFAGGAESHAGHLAEAPGPEVAGLSVTIASAGRSAEIVLASARSGVNQAEITLLDGTGRPLQAQDVTFIAANPAAGVEPIRRTAEPAGPGRWRVDELLLVPAGRWSLRVDVLMSDFEKAIFETEVALR
jgi:copper transport protein